MTYYAYDVDGYLGDAASVGGWDAFAAWAAKQSGAVRNLALDGYSAEPAQLVQELRAATATDPNADSVRRGLAALASVAKEVFIVSDAMGED